MRQHIRVRAKLIENRTKVEVIILEQTHVYGEFGPIDNWGVGGLFRATNGVRLMSQTCPGWYGVYTEVYLRGDDSDYDKRPIVMTLPMWRRFKQAIIEYNEWGEKQ